MKVLKKTGKVVLLMVAVILYLMGNRNAISSALSSDSISVSSDESRTEWYESVPEYSGNPYVEINHNVPFFTKTEKAETDAFETYSELDGLGRVGVAYASLCDELMPTADREDISSVKPSGWKNCQYMINGKTFWIYNRSHLIAYSLAGENANEKNLMTGTDYFNHDGMIPFETTVRDYLNDRDNNGKHVLYRVTPYFEEDDLVAKGVLMEAWSVEDHGYEVQFCVYVYNVQPGIEIDYATGESTKD